MNKECDNCHGTGLYQGKVTCDICAGRGKIEVVEQQEAEPVEAEPVETEPVETEPVEAEPNTISSFFKSIFS